MKSVAAASLFFSVALAASSSLIPDGISTDCTQYLAKLNANTALSACTTALLSATKAFQAGSTGTASDVTSALTQVCSTSTQQVCQSSTIRGILADFYAACPAELVGTPNKKAIALYDVLYVLVPYREALCARDDSGAFCALKQSVLSVGSSASASASASASSTTGAPTLANGASLSSVQKYLSTSDGAHSLPNATTFSSSNVNFLFLQAALPSDKLCTTCARQTLAAYIDFETLANYAPGLGNSQLIAGQSALYKAVTSTCGASFLQGAVQAAGSLGDGLLGSSKKSGAVHGVVQLGGAATAFAGLVVALAAL